MTSERKKPCIHAGHREHMREKALHFGFESFADHEFLEVVLYSANARGNTNEQAHLLMERFGSLHAVMEASAQELMTVPGIGAQAAVQIMALMEGLRRYYRAELLPTERYDTIQKIAEYMWTYFCGLKQERLYMLLFDNKMAMIDAVLLSSGTISETNVPVRSVLHMAVKREAANVVLAHNHPHGVAIPSDNDVEVTRELAERFQAVEIPLREHIVIADDRFTSIMKTHYRLPHVMASTRGVSDDSFDLAHFYNVDEETYRFSEHFKPFNHQ